MQRWPAVPTAPPAGTAGLEGELETLQQRLKELQYIQLLHEEQHGTVEIREPYEEEEGALSGDPEDPEPRVLWGADRVRVYNFCLDTNLRPILRQLCNF